MPTDKPRFTITVDESLMHEIENFRYENRIKNQTQAVIKLMELGLQEILKGTPIDTSIQSEMYSSDEKALIEDYRNLNKQGQEYIRQTMYMAKQTYKKMPDVSDMENQA